MSGTAAAPQLTAEARRALVEQRIDDVRALLDRHSAPALVLASRRGFAWLTVGGLNHVVLATDAGVAPIVVTPSAVTVLAPVNEAARLADEEVAGLPLEIEELPWWESSAIDDRAAALAGGRVVAEEDLGGDLVALRERLAPPEHARLEWLGGLARQAVDGALADCEPGSTEHDLEAAAVARLSAAATRCPVVLVAADDRIDRYRHPLATARAVERRVMLVVVAERWGLHAALTGMLELEEPSAELRQRNEAVAEVLAAMRAATQPGRTLGDVLAAAQTRYDELGFGEEWRLHHQGGSVGYAGRERIAVPGDTSAIVPGMAFAWNPSVRGAKAEETFYLDASGKPRLVTD